MGPIKNSGVCFSSKHTQGIYGSVLQKKSEAYKEIESPGKLFFFFKFRDRVCVSVVGQGAVFRQKSIRDLNYILSAYFF